MARQARHYSGREALETRVDYVEGKLDAAIASFKEVNAEIKEMIKQSEARLETDRLASERRQEATEKRLEAERIAAEYRILTDRETFERRFVEERKEWRETKRWLYINFGGVIAILITIALATYGFILN